MDQAANPEAAKSGWLNLVVDYGPVLVFFVTYRYCCGRTERAMRSPKSWR